MKIFFFVLNFYAKQSRVPFFLLLLQTRNRFHFVQGQNASGSSNSSVNNAAMITSNVNHISSPSCSVSPQTFTAYSTQQPSSRKVSGTHTHENKFKLVAVPNLHAHANMQGQGSSTAGLVNERAPRRTNKKPLSNLIGQRNEQFTTLGCTTKWPIFNITKWPILKTKQKGPF